MSCANCGRTYEEHRDGLAYRDFTGAAAECGEYEEAYAVEFDRCWQWGSLLEDCDCANV